MLGTQKVCKFKKKFPDLLRWLVVIGATLLLHGYIADVTFIVHHSQSAILDSQEL